VLLNLLYVFWANRGTLWGDIENHEIIISQAILSIAVLSISLLRYFNYNKDDFSIFLVQTFGVFVLMFLPKDQVETELVDLVFVLYVIGSVGIWMRNHKMFGLKERKQESRNILMGLGGFILLINFMSVWEVTGSFTSVNYDILIFATILLGSMPFISSESYDAKFTSITQVINLFLLSFSPIYESRYIDETDTLALGLMIYLGQLIVLNYLKYKESDISSIFHTILNVLVMVFIIFETIGFDIRMPKPIFLAILVVGSYFSFYQINDEAKKWKATYRQITTFIIFTLVDEQTILDIRLISVIISIYTITIMFNWIRQRKNLKILEANVFGLTILTLIFSFMSYTSDLIIPAYEVIALVVLSSIIPLIIDPKLGIKAQYLYTIVICILPLAWFDQDRTDGVMPYYELVGTISGFSVVYTIFLLLCLYLWFRDRSDRDKINLYPIAILALTGSITFLSVIYANFFLSPLLISLGTVSVLLMTIYFKESSFVEVYAVAAVNIFLLALFPLDTAIALNPIYERNDALIDISAIVYMVFVALILVKWYLTPSLKDNTMFVANIPLLTFLLAIQSLWDAYTPMEFLGIGLLMYFPVLLMSNDRIATQVNIAIASLSLFSLVWLQDEIFHLFPVEIDESTIHTLIPSILYIITTISVILLLRKWEDKAVWNATLGAFFSITILSSIIPPAEINPVILGLAILSMAYPMYILSEGYLREVIPVAQAIGILFLLARPVSICFDTCDALELQFVAILYLVWTITILGVWYFRGTVNQIFTSMTGIYGLAAVFSIISLLAGPTEEVNLEILLIAIVGTTLFSLILYPRLSRAPSSYVAACLVSAVLSMIFMAATIREFNSGNTETYYRLIVDFLVFIPILGEVILGLRYYLKTKITSIEQFDPRIVYLLGGFVLVAFLMKAEGVFSLKILAIAVSFWIIALSYTHSSTSWASSIFTVLASAYLLYQIDTGADTVNDTDRVTSYFIVIAIIGVIMVIAAIYNEKKYRGEPLTASLATTGSLVTFVAIVVPLMIVDGEGKIYSEQVIAFLPNLIWAIQGLGLFVITQQLSKIYLRRIALGILTVNIVKTGWDLFGAVENILIRSVGAIVLGSILVYIFYMFKEPEKKEDTASHRHSCGNLINLNDSKNFCTSCGESIVELKEQYAKGHE
jgi:hypothetical protein